jgi:hypothetical protein
MHVDPKLARGLTMAEARRILRSDPGSVPATLRDERHPVRQAAKAVLWRYRTGRRPDDRFVRGLADALDAIHAKDPRTVSREARDMPELGSAPGGPWFERRYVHLGPTDPGEGCRTLKASCTTAIVGEANATLNQVQLFEVHLHVIDRFHERTRSGLVRDAMRTFGTELMVGIGLIWAMMEMSSAVFDGSFAVPFADGLILAGMVERPFLDVEPYCLYQPLGRSPVVYEDRDARMASRSLKVSSYAARLATFVGPAEMNPRQVRFRDAVLALAGTHAAHVAHVSDMMTATGRVIGDLAEPGAESAMERRSRAFERAVADLVADPEMARAMGVDRKGGPTVTRAP